MNRKNLSKRTDRVFLESPSDQLILQSEEELMSSCSEYFTVPTSSTKKLESWDKHGIQQDSEKEDLSTQRFIQDGDVHSKESFKSFNYSRSDLKSRKNHENKKEFFNEPNAFQSKDPNLNMNSESTAPFVQSSVEIDGLVFIKKPEENQHSHFQTPSDFGFPEKLKPRRPVFRPWCDSVLMSMALKLDQRHVQENLRFQGQTHSIFYQNQVIYRMNCTIHRASTHGISLVDSLYPKQATRVPTNEGSSGSSLSQKATSGQNPRYSETLPLPHASTKVPFSRLNSFPLSQDLSSSRGKQKSVLKTVVPTETSSTTIHLANFVSKRIGTLHLFNLLESFGIIREGFIHTRQNFALVQYVSLDAAKNCLHALENRTIFGFEFKAQFSHVQQLEVEGSKYRKKYKNGAKRHSQLLREPRFGSISRRIKLQAVSVINPGLDKISLEPQSVFSFFSTLEREIAYELEFATVEFGTSEVYICFDTIRVALEFIMAANNATMCVDKSLVAELTFA